MKRKAILLFLIIAAIFSVGASNDVPGKEPGTMRSIEFKKDRRKNDRPRMPQKKNINAYYVLNNLCIDFIYPEGEADIEISNMNDGSIEQRETVDTNMNISIYIPDEEGTYQIDIITSKGNHYVGYLIF
ncbi:MAG: DUF3244 domain-containing protein [Bacteroides sp.]|nr:DUF3244 domain-containing protein [Bacteroides sp.]MCM1390554.1 DUF3244 domain-containing protein [Bacteroides sp.]